MYKKIKTIKIYCLTNGFYVEVDKQDNLTICHLAHNEYDNVKMFMCYVRAPRVVDENFIMANISKYIDRYLERWQVYEKDFETIKNILMPDEEYKISCICLQNVIVYKTKNGTIFEVTKVDEIVWGYLSLHDNESKILKIFFLDENGDVFDEFIENIEIIFSKF